MSVLDAKVYFETILQLGLWGDLADQTVMDIGCGNGENSTRRLVEMYPNIKRLIGIDQDSSSIRNAELQSNHPKIEYRQADILEWSTLSEWEGQINVAISYHSINCIDEKFIAFENVYKLLKPGGTAAFWFSMRANQYDWDKEMAEMYSNYGINYELEPLKWNRCIREAFKKYRRDVMNLGFDILLCRDIDYTEDIESDIKCKDYLCGLQPLPSNMPCDLMNKFREDVFTLFLKYNPRRKDGSMFITRRVAEILVRKPTDE